MKKIIISVLGLIIFSAYGYSQDKGNSSDFKPNGKPIVTIFTDFRDDFQNSKSNPGFDITRAYFGYQYKFNPDFSTKVVLDVTSGQNSSGSYPTAFSTYLKNAYGEYSKSGFKADLGMIGTTAFNLQESIWGKRYLLKSFQDLNNYSSSADLGLGLSYQFAPQFSADVQVLNGEGYKKVQADSTFKFALGLTCNPIQNLYIRVYGDYMGKHSGNGDGVAQKTFNAFVAYKDESLTLAGEYNLQNGHGNVTDHNLNGFSLYGTYKPVKEVGIFARYDYLKSKKINGASTGWNEGKGTIGSFAGNDGDLYAFGIELFPVKGMAVSPNIQISDPKLSTAKSTTSFLVSLSYSL